MSRTSLNNVKSILAPLALAMFAGAALAGPLTPAAGPVGSTMKTMAEVEPRIAINATNTPGGSVDTYRITQRGSYYLTGNINLAAGKSGISVETSNVTIDLNGFAIIGQTGTQYGVYGSGGAVYQVTVRNGSISNVGSSGVYFPGPYSQPQAITVEGVSVKNCGDNGIQIGSGIVRDCQVSKNTGVGIFLTDPKDSVVENCTANDNSSGGINVLQGTIRGCSASANTTTGISLGAGTITQCAAISNATGIISNSGTVVDSTAIDNTTTGILVNGDCVVRGNSVTADMIRPNTIGIQVQNTTGARIENNQITRMNVGINCLTANNLVVGNSLRGCNNAFNVLANNRIGTIVIGTASPAIFGNAGGGLGTTDPFANIIH